jgi:hypothetical protein
MVLKKTYTFWGGLQLDKDVRKLSTFFSQIFASASPAFTASLNNQLSPSSSSGSSSSNAASSGAPLISVREKFTKLVQMASILQLDRASEILDYWGENANNSSVWKLKAETVKKVLSLRADFSQREIAQLKL